jgi:hypothetical protein
VEWFSTLMNYLLLGVVFNAAYDFAITYIKKEELRFTMVERVVFAIVWPIYVLLLIINFIKTIINGSNKDD